jgi:hypothetical protein
MLSKVFTRLIEHFYYNKDTSYGIYVYQGFKQTYLDLKLKLTFDTATLALKILQKWPKDNPIDRLNP